MTRKIQIREIWIKFKDEDDYEKHTEEVRGIAEKYNGDYKLVAYMESQKSIRRCNLCTGKEAIPELVAKLGEDFVKVVETEREEVCEEIYRKTGCEIPQPSLDERAVCALEGIENNLERSADSLEALSDCTVESMGSVFFNVCGYMGMN